MTSSMVAFDTRRNRAVLPAIASCLCLMAALGCEERVVARHGFASLIPEQTDPPKAKKNDGGFLGLGKLFGGEKESKDGSTWAIAVDGFSGPGSREQAVARRDLLVQQTGMADFWVNAEPYRTMIYYGRYKSPNSDEAARDLRTLQTLAGQGRIRAVGLIITPVETVEAADTIAPHDLRRAAAHGLYTLQIATFEDEQKPQRAREDAERYADELRKQDVEAFFFHGPNRSQVTVGVFGPEAIEWTKDANNKDHAVYTPVVEQVIKQFPHHSMNGKTIMLKKPGANESVPQGSFLVRIPGSRETYGPGLRPQ